MTPGSLAIVESAFHPDDRGAAIGAWSGLGGIAGAIGPFLGGWLISAVSWRLIFFINLPLAAVVIWVVDAPRAREPGPGGPGPAARPGRRDAHRARAGRGHLRPDRGAREWLGLPRRPPPGGASASCALAAFLLVERTSDHPMVPLGMFRTVQFSAANLVTFVVYAALGGALFLLPLAAPALAGLLAARRRARRSCR